MNKKAPAPKVTYEYLEGLEKDSINDVFDYLFRRLFEERPMA